MKVKLKDESLEIQWENGDDKIRNILEMLLSNVEFIRNNRCKYESEICLETVCSIFGRYRDAILDGGRP